MHSVSPVEPLLVLGNGVHGCLSGTVSKVSELVGHFAHGGIDACLVLQEERTDNTVVDNI